MSARMPQKPFSGDLDKHPVLTVSWDDIRNPDGFCEWASDVAGFKLTLPTEERWEYAARGGKDALLYPWGNDFDRSKLWCSDYWYEDYPAVGKDPVDRRKSKARCVRGGSWSAAIRSSSGALIVSGSSQLTGTTSSVFVFPQDRSSILFCGAVFNGPFSGSGLCLWLL